MERRGQRRDRFNRRRAGPESTLTDTLDGTFLLPREATRYSHKRCQSNILLQYRPPQTHPNTHSVFTHHQERN